MSRDLADLVLQTIRRAVAPILDRLAAAEGRLQDATRRLSDLDVALVLARASDASAARLAVSLDGLTETVAGLRERLATVEARPVPGPVDGVVLDRLAAAEGTLQDVTRRLADLDVVLAAARVSDAERARLAGILDGFAETVAGLRERLATVEARPVVAGPAGPAGLDGKDGTNGLDGRNGEDGLGFDDVRVEFDDDHTLAIVFERGPREQRFPIVLPFLRYHGVFREAVRYARGDVVTWNGCAWHCLAEETSTRPGGGAKDWTLIVKAGRDGRDGKDGPPGPKGDRGQSFEELYDAKRRA